MTAREQVEAALTEVRARLRAHGGDATVAAVEDGVAEIRWHGACQSCPAVALTLNGVVGPAVLAVPGVHAIASARPVSPHALQRLERAARRYEAAPAASRASRCTASRRPGTSSGVTIHDPPQATTQSSAA